MSTKTFMYVFLQKRDKVFVTSFVTLLRKKTLFIFW